MKLHIYSPQDPSVGLWSISATVEIERFEPNDEEHATEIKEYIREVFSNILDDGHITVTAE